MNDAFFALTACVTGGLGVLAGILAHRGHYRYWLRWYDDPDLPFFVRNAALGWVPAGIGLIALGLGIFVFDQNPTRPWAGFAAMSLFFASLLCVVLITHYSPTWIKPRWLRERDVMVTPRASTTAEGPLAVFLAGIGGLGAGAFLLLALMAL